MSINFCPLAHNRNRRRPSASFDHQPLHIATAARHVIVAGEIESLIGRVTVRVHGGAVKGPARTVSPAMPTSTRYLVLLAVISLLSQASARAVRKDDAVRVRLEGNKNDSRPRGVFLFDDNCLWYLHGKGRLVAKINCVPPSKQAPMIVATRRHGRLRYKLHHGPPRPGKLRRSRTGQIPLKCFYRYDAKGVFYLTRCYTRTPGYGPVEMNFQGHLPKKPKNCKKGRCRKERKLRRRRWRRRRKEGRKGKHGRRRHERLSK